MIDDGLTYPDKGPEVSSKDTPAEAKPNRRYIVFGIAALFCVAITAGWCGVVLPAGYLSALTDVTTWTLGLYFVPKSVEHFAPGIMNKLKK